MNKNKSLTGFPFYVDEALLFFRAVQIHPGYGLALGNLGYVFNEPEVERYDLSKKFCEKALKIDPNYSFAQRDLKFAQDKIREKWTSKLVGELFAKYLC